MRCSVGEWQIDNDHNGVYRVTFRGENINQFRESLPAIRYAQWRHEIQMENQRSAFETQMEPPKSNIDMSEIARAFDDIEWAENKLEKINHKRAAMLDDEAIYNDLIEVKLQFLKCHLSDTNYQDKFGPKK